MKPVIPFVPVMVPGLLPGLFCPVSVFKTGKSPDFSLCTDTFGITISICKLCKELLRYRMHFCSFFLQGSRKSPEMPYLNAKKTELLNLMENSESDFIFISLLLFGFIQFIQPVPDKKFQMFFFSFCNPFGIEAVPVVDVHDFLKR